MWLYLLVSRALRRQKNILRSIENAGKRRSNELSDHILGKEAIHTYTKEGNNACSACILSHIVLKHAGLKIASYRK